MVLLAVRRAVTSLDWLLIDELGRLSKQVYYFLQQQADGVASDGNSPSRKRRRVKEEHWTVQRDGEHDTIKIINDNDTNNNLSSAAASEEDMHTVQLINTLQTIRNLTTKTLPELSSRIIHATSPILHELSRGFFVPFLTVALACLGRIHVLMLRLGRELVGTLSQHVPKLRECVVGRMRRKGTGENNGGLIQKLEEAISPLFSVPTMKEGSGDDNGCQNEWNDLMKQFIEVSHDDFTKKVNNFVNEHRWKDALAAFGIKEDDLNEMQMSSQSDAQGGKEEEDGKHVNSNNMSIDDMGELVYMQPDQGDEKDTTKRSGANVDDNMARVLDNKRRIDEISTTSAATKKKRRKKKKKNPGDSEIRQEDAADSITKIAADESVKVESEQSAGSIKKIAEESIKEASKQSDKELNSDDEPLRDFEVMLDADESDVEPSAKKKQKKSKKKKIKKKKSNVIDDIFG